MSKTAWIALVVVVILGFILFSHNRGTTPATTSGTATTTAPTGDPIKIGFIGPLTGDAASLGQNAKAAVEIAVDEVNKSGGISGRPLQMIYEDGGCKAATAASAASKLINVDKVTAILGAACSSETSSFAGAANQAKVPVLSYCSSAPTITNAGDYIFRDYPSDLYQGSFGADYVYNTLGKKKVAILYVQNDYGSGIQTVFATKFKQLGGTVVATEAYSQTATDLRSQITKIKNANPDIVYFLGYTDASLIALKQFKDLGVAAPLFGGDAWDDTKIWSTAGAAGEGAMYSVPAAVATEVFKANLKAKVGNDEVGACTPYAYDGVKILSQVIGQVGTSGVAIKDKLYTTTYSGGVSSRTVSFDQNGDLVNANYIVKTIKNGKAEVK